MTDGVRLAGFALAVTKAAAKFITLLAAQRVERIPKVRRPRLMPGASRAKRFAKRSSHVIRAYSNREFIRRYSSHRQLQTCSHSLRSRLTLVVPKKVAARFPRLAVKRKSAKRSSTNASVFTVIHGIPSCRVRNPRRAGCRRRRFILCATACWKTSSIRASGRSKKEKSRRLVQSITSSRVPRPRFRWTR